MLAFVLSGGGNLGALQVGAMRAVLQRGYAPGLLVGTSAGALNAAYLAAYPDDEGLSSLERCWQEAARARLYPGGPLQALWRWIRGKESLFPNTSLYRFIKDHMPPGISKFRDLRGPRLFITAARLPDGALRLFGESPEDSLLDALMSSTAMPPYFPPWRCADGSLCIDGGVVAVLPVEIAVARGAKEVYAFHILPYPSSSPVRRKISLLDLSGLALSPMLQCQVETQMLRAVKQFGKRVHRIPLFPPRELPFWDFSHAAELIEAGYQQAMLYLASSQRSSSAWFPMGQILERLRVLGGCAFHA
ncbi:patatin-like phospholipase family protein [Thermoflexus hugenholtzii]